MPYTPALSTQPRSASRNPRSTDRRRIIWLSIPLSSSVDFKSFNSSIRNRMASDTSSCTSSEDESCVVVRGIGSHRPGWRRRRNRIEAELNAAHDISHFRVKVHTPGCLPQWQTGRLTVPRLKPTYPAQAPPMPFAKTLIGKLPTELRLKIYGYAFGCPDRPISIRKRLFAQSDGFKLPPTECKQPAPHSHWYHDCWDGKLLVFGDKPLISLVLTCRQM